MVSFPRTDQLQPLCAVYRTDAMVAACESALENGNRRIDTVVATLPVATVERDEIQDHGSLETFENVDTPAELTAVRNTSGDTSHFRWLLATTSDISSHKL